jgi:hypothetical protein
VSVKTGPVGNVSVAVDVTMIDATSVALEPADVSARFVSEVTLPVIAGTDDGSCGCTVIVKLDVAAPLDGCGNAINPFVMLVVAGRTTPNAASVDAVEVDVAELADTLLVVIFGPHCARVTADAATMRRRTTTDTGVQASMGPLHSSIHR